MGRKLKFFIESQGETIEDAEEFYVRDDGSLTAAAEEFADYFHDNRDGWEARWPVVFSVTEAGQVLGRVSVERESTPLFTGKVL